MANNGYQSFLDKKLGYFRQAVKNLEVAQQVKPEPVDLALLTWYHPDHELYRDPLHPTIKLAGEVGELLDLYAKDKFKPGFSWWRCKYCRCGSVSHSLDTHKCPDLRGVYTPLVLDELGDVWYYLRILAWMYDIEFVNHCLEFKDSLYAIKRMYFHASFIINGSDEIYSKAIQNIYDCLVMLLALLDYNIEQLTELNYYKLNSEPTNHGWKGA